MSHFICFPRWRRVARRPNEIRPGRQRRAAATAAARSRVGDAGRPAGSALARRGGRSRRRGKAGGGLAATPAEGQGSRGQGGEQGERPVRDRELADRVAAGRAANRVAEPAAIPPADPARRGPAGGERPGVGEPARASPASIAPAWTNSRPYSIARRATTTPRAPDQRAPVRVGPGGERGRARATATRRRGEREPSRPHAVAPVAAARIPGSGPGWRGGRSRKWGRGRAGARRHARTPQPQCGRHEEQQRDQPVGDADVKGAVAVWPGLVVVIPPHGAPAGVDGVTVVGGGERVVVRPPRVAPVAEYEARPAAALVGGDVIEDFREARGRLGPSGDDAEPAAGTQVDRCAGGAAVGEPTVVPPLRLVRAASPPDPQHAHRDAQEQRHSRADREQVAGEAAHRREWYQKCAGPRFPFLRPRRARRRRMGRRRTRIADVRRAGAAGHEIRTPWPSTERAARCRAALARFDHRV